MAPSSGLTATGLTATGLTATGLTATGLTATAPPGPAALTGGLPSRCARPVPPTGGKGEQSNPTLSSPPPGEGEGPRQRGWGSLAVWTAFGMLMLVPSAHAGTTTVNIRAKPRPSTAAVIPTPVPLETQGPAPVGASPAATPAPTARPAATARPAPVAVVASLPPAPLSRLVGRAVLPADTFAPGPSCGRWLGRNVLRGRSGPFIGKQPVQGFSAILPGAPHLAGDPPGWFTVLVDNGFGTLETSADSRLRMYAIKPAFETGPSTAANSIQGGILTSTPAVPAAPRGFRPRSGGEITVGPFIELSDPDRKLSYPITHAFSRTRPLTGADLDPESFQRMPDGSYWIGEEFGPYLVHVDATGKVLEPPVPLPDFDPVATEGMPPKGPPTMLVRSPQNPGNEETIAVRVMNALAADARGHGYDGPLTFSPWHLMLDDADPKTFVPERDQANASSEVFNVASLRAAGHRVIPWTVNDPARMAALLKLGVDGIISDRPDLLHAALAAFDANGDGKPGDMLDRDGLIDPAKFLAQGHRGARDLRPENTLPAFEAALDHLVNVLETDCAITKDGVVVLSHDPVLEAAKTRRLDGKPYTHKTERVIHHLTLREVQTTYARDLRLPDRPQQRMGAAFSPIATAWAKRQKWANPYLVPTLAELFDFVRFYHDAQAKLGQKSKIARARARNAGRIHFNLETKITPQDEAAGHVPGPRSFTRAVIAVVGQSGQGARTTIQSFDYRTLLVAHRESPDLGTVLLVEDAVPFAMRGPGVKPPPPNTGEAELWRDVLAWPWRQTARTRPMRGQRSGGFEGMALSWDKRTLYPIMEKTLAGAPADLLPIYAYDTVKRRYTGERWSYPQVPGARSVSDFVMIGPRDALAIERDDREGDMTAFKRLTRVTLGKPGTVVTTTAVADLLRIADPTGISLPARKGDVGLGNPFGLPFFTIEGILLIDPTHVGLVIDNNYPYSSGRHKGSGAPDDDEFVVLQLAKPLPLGAGFTPIKWR